MNILLSNNWLKEYVDFNLEPKELARLLSLHSMSVERILPEIELLSEHVVLGQIKEIKPHPDADKLQIALVDDGEGVHQVVCGAPNIAEGMKILFTRPGAMVRWHGEGEPVLLEPAKIRGIESYGMITDDSEVGLSAELNEEGVTDYSHLKAKVGTPMAKALGLDDTVFDIEITTNRIDAGCVTGMAREVAAMTGSNLKAVKSYKLAKPSKDGVKKLSVKIDASAKDMCKGFVGVVLDGVSVQSSPEWMQRRLMSAGIQPVNVIVDVTNYVMHEYGHPLHAFDYDKVTDGAIVVRAANKKERLTTLDGKEEELAESMVVVADKNLALALGGIMGGEESKITETTSTILLEAATWNPTTIRRGAQALDKFSDASSYFAKGVSPQSAEIALMRAIELILEITDAHVASELVSKGYKAYKPKKVKMTVEKAEKYIGTSLSVPTMKKQLTDLGFKVTANKTSIECEVPHWRQYDVAIEEDLIEEVARLHGYQNIENKLPSGELPFPEFTPQLEWESSLRSLLSGSGFTECFTYSMVSEQLHALGGRKLDEAIRILNPLDDEHVVMRTALFPSLVEVAAQNQGITNTMKLFEIANVYEPKGKNDLPEEIPMLVGLVSTGDLEHDFRVAKGMVDRIMKDMGLHEDVFAKRAVDLQVFHKESNLNYMLGDAWAGSVGVVASSLAKGVGLKQKSVGFILPIQDLIEQARSAMTYAPAPKFPAVELDLSIIVSDETAWGDVEIVTRKAGGELLKQVELFDIYKHKDEGKSFGFHLFYRHDERTLEMSEIEPIQQQIVSALEKELGAELKA